MTLQEKALASPPSSPLVWAAVIDSERGLQGLAEQWEALYAECARPNHCASHAWVKAWWNAFGKDPKHVHRGSLFVVVLRDVHGQLVGVAPMYEEIGSRASMRLRRLRFVGHFGHDGDHDMTEEPTLLIRDGWETRVLEAIADALRPHIERARWDLVFFRCMREGTASFLEAATSSLRREAIVRTETKPGSDHAVFPQTWTDLRKSLSRSMRDNLAYYPRLLTRDGHDWSIRIVRDPGMIGEAAERLADLHTARSQMSRGATHSNHIESDTHRAFLVSHLRDQAKLGRAYVAELVVAEETIAAQAFLEHGDSLLVYYSGFKESWYKYSPIFVIGSFVFKEALEQRGVRHLNFLSHSAAWKSRWGAYAGPAIHRAFIVPRSLDCQARFALHCAGIVYSKLSANRWEIVRSRLRSLRMPKSVSAQAPATE